MKVVPLRSQLEEAESTLDLATRLGRVCLDEEQTLFELIDDPVLQKLRRAIEGTVAAMDPAALDAPGPDANFVHLLETDGLGELVAIAEARHPLEHFTVLRAMLGAVRRAYDALEGQIVLRPGTPVPVVKRGRRFRMTPDHDTVGINSLLRGSGFYLYELPVDDRVEVRLDFSVGERLDEVTWTQEGRLPKIATIHPALGEDGVSIGEVNGDWFFDVSPDDWDLEGILAQLRSVAEEAAIAILPELSLPQADSLEAALGADPGLYPPLVVAGSAHVRELVGEGDGVREVRANESRIYLDGVPVGSHRKIQPFPLRRMPDGTRLLRPLQEGITPERKAITILSGEYTRLAVMICADVNSKKLTMRLMEAGVNLCLVPALTPETGGFNGGIGALASYCQGVSVIANADGSLFRGLPREPFLAMAAVPRPEAEEQTREFRREDGDGCPCVGIFDPNERLTDASPWR